MGSGSSWNVSLQRRVLESLLKGKRATRKRATQKRKNRRILLEKLNAREAPGTVLDMAVAGTAGLLDAASHNEQASHHQRAHHTTGAGPSSHPKWTPRAPAGPPDNTTSNTSSRASNSPTPSASVAHPVRNQLGPVLRLFSEDAFAFTDNPDTGGEEVADANSLLSSPSNSSGNSNQGGGGGGVKSPSPVAADNAGKASQSPTSNSNASNGGGADASPPALDENGSPIGDNTASGDVAEGSDATGQQAEPLSNNVASNSDAANSARETLSRPDPATPVSEPVVELKSVKSLGRDQFLIRGGIQIDSQDDSDRDNKRKSSGRVSIELFGVSDGAEHSLGTTQLKQSPRSEISFSSVIETNNGSQDFDTFFVVVDLGASSSIRSNEIGLSSKRDADGDGIDDGIEDLVRGGDGNRDGIRDNQQRDVTSLPTRSNGKFVTISGKGKGLRSVRLTDTFDTDPTHQVNLPYGQFEFVLEDVPVGGIAQVELFLPDDNLADTYYKLEPETGELVPFPFDGETGAIVSGNKVTLFLQDGGRGDADGIANGVILDPGTATTGVVRLNSEGPTGLEGWTISQYGGTPTDMGSVVFENGDLVIHEGDSHLVMLERDIVVPDLPQEIVFEFSEFFETGGAFINDAFEVALLDSTGRTVVAPFQSGRSSYFNLTEGELPAYSLDSTTYSSQSLSVDISELEPGTTVTLVLSLVNDDDDTGSKVVIHTNVPPDAVDDDFYKARSGKTLLVAAPGVLKNDSDADDDSLVSLIVNGPTNGTLNLAPDGSFSYTSVGGFVGTDSFVYLANDQWLDSQPATVTIDVNAANEPPALGLIADQTIDEETELAFTVTAHDPDLPLDTLTLSTGGIPAGANFDPSTGIFTWTPTEAQGPGEYSVTFNVTDDGSSALSDSQTVNITVDEVNKAPILDAIGDQSIDEHQTLTFTATATDYDDPVNGIEFFATNLPAGASIDRATGVFEWTPDESQGPHTYFVTVIAKDDGSPIKSDSEVVTITVAEVNEAPMLNDIADPTIAENELVTIVVSAMDSDLPANNLTYPTPISLPAGAYYNEQTRTFSWQPTESQGPGVYEVEFVVHDNGNPDLTDTETVTITVTEENQRPELDPIPNWNIDEKSLLNFFVSGSDTDVPQNVLAYSMENSPGGATLDASTGEFNWTPTESQGPDVVEIVFKVTDDGSPADSESQTVTITVNEVNEAPVLGAIGNWPINELDTVAFVVAATDPDDPANVLTLEVETLSGDPLPVGASFDEATGDFSWTPTEAQGPDVVVLVVSVTDNGTTALSDAETVTITVAEVNDPPVLNAIDDHTIDELVAHTFTLLADDPVDVPKNGLTYSSPDLPSGATLNATTGVFDWTPSAAQGPGEYLITFVVTDDGSPNLTDTQTVTITVNDGNNAPILGTISDLTRDELTLIDFTVTASDPDLDGVTLSVSGLPGGANFNVSTGYFDWTPSESQGPESYEIIFTATDDGNPSLTDTKTITITVEEVNEAPVLNTIPDEPVNEGSTVDFTVTAFDNDAPANTLVFSVDPLPVGASFDETTGEFSWTPTEAQGPDVVVLTFTVSDNGSPISYR